VTEPFPVGSMPGAGKTENVSSGFVWSGHGESPRAPTVASEQWLIIYDAMRQRAYCEYCDDYGGEGEE
jgi:hypothetical protein